MGPATLRFSRPPGHLEALAGLRQPPNQQAVSDVRVSASRIKSIKSIIYKCYTNNAMEGILPKGHSDACGRWALLNDRKLHTQLHNCTHNCEFLRLAEASLPQVPGLVEDKRAIPADPWAALGSFTLEEAMAGRPPASGAATSWLTSEGAKRAVGWVGPWLGGFLAMAGLAMAGLGERVSWRASRLNPCRRWAGSLN